MHIGYSPHYNITFFGIERLHPFDSRKYVRAWKLLRAEFGSALEKYHLRIDRPVSDEELALVHSPEYLKSLRSSATLARALEIPLLHLLPSWLIQWRVLRPMRWAVRGSVLAAQAALKTGWAVNLSGGYHHAKPSQGEGFCIFSDIALIARQLRRDGMLQPNEQIVYIDLDAHQGNGVCHNFLEDERFSIYDMYNRDNYPKDDFRARDRIDCNIPVAFNCLGFDYLRILQERLPPFLDSLTGSRKPRLAIYNAGTDVLAGDRLGGLFLSADEVLARDLFAIGEMRQRQIPFVMLLSGGYNAESHRLVAATVAKLLRE